MNDFEPQINVQPIKRGSWGKNCRLFGKNIKCNDIPNMMIFGGDGKARSSRLEGCVCQNHLALAIKRIKKRQIEVEFKDYYDKMKEKERILQELVDRIDDKNN